MAQTASARGEGTINKLSKTVQAARLDCCHSWCDSPSLRKVWEI